jgi:hypothetical protein
MDQADRQQHGQPAHEQDRAARITGQPLELDGEARAEQQREQRQRLEVDGDRQDGAHGPVERPRRFGARQELREDGNAEHGHDVHGEHAEQGQAPQHVDGADPLRRAYGRRTTGHAALLNARQGRVKPPPKWRF